jgi:hypothetical protein
VGLCLSLTAIKPFVSATVQCTAAAFRTVVRSPVLRNISRARPYLMVLRSRWTITRFTVRTACAPQNIYLIRDPELKGEAIVNHFTRYITNISKPGSRGREGTTVGGGVPFVTTLLAGLMLLLLLPAGARADTFFVDKVEDSLMNLPNYYCTNTAYMGNCSLRIAIEAANSVIARAGGDHTIVLKDETLRLKGSVPTRWARDRSSSGPAMSISGTNKLVNVMYRMRVLSTTLGATVLSPSPASSVFFMWLRGHPCHSSG